jgi:hypothetical protein
MGHQLGLDMKLYYNSGTRVSPTNVLITNVRDLTGPDSFSEADVSRRASGRKQSEPALRDISFEWEMVYDPTDTAFVLIQTRYYARTMIELILANDAIATSGTEYLRVECKLTKFERNEALEGANLYSVVAKPCWPGYALFGTTP